MESIVFNISQGILINLTEDYNSLDDGKDYSNEGGNSEGAPSFSTPLHIYITVSVFYIVIFILGVVGKSDFDSVKSSTKGECL